MANLIVDMDVPRACRWKEDGTTKRCPIAEWGGACAVTKLFEPSYDSRPPWCPIKGVLPDEHGDLVDRNELKEKFIVGDFIGDCAREMIDAAPTIIAAERREK